MKPKSPSSIELALNGMSQLGKWHYEYSLQFGRIMYFMSIGGLRCGDEGSCLPGLAMVCGSVGVPGVKVVTVCWEWLLKLLLML